MIGEQVREAYTPDGDIAELWRWVDPVGGRVLFEFRWAEGVGEPDVLLPMDTIRALLGGDDG